MNFVNDEDLVTVTSRPDRYVIDDHVTHVIDAGVGRSVNFEHVERGARRDLHAGRTLQTGPAGNARVTVKSLGEYSCGGRLACASHGGKQVGMVKTPLIESVAQRARNMFLTC